MTRRLTDLRLAELLARYRHMAKGLDPLPGEPVPWPMEMLALLEELHGRREQEEQAAQLISAAMRLGTQILDAAQDCIELPAGHGPSHPSDRATDRDRPRVERRRHA
ncbi:MAG TPA: hypothetical protein VFG43_14840 [Geminicoccaceae bacterium]|nr:hypothetical protein [Geminicoccaceae bacterium]